MDQDTADSSTHALTKLALLAAELNTRANLADVTASVLHAALELNDASISAVANLDGGGFVSVSSLRRSELPQSDRVDRSRNDSGDERRGQDERELIRKAVRRSEMIPIDDLSIGIISACIHSEQSSWHRQIPEHSMLGGASQALGHPVHDESGTLVAVLGLGWDTDTPFGTDARSVAEFFCDLTASSLVRARRNEELAGLATQMRTALLPALAIHDELDVAFDYVPALNTIGFGGDWFDIIETVNGRTILVVGDIAGHGVEAAARMALAQGAVRALSQLFSIHEIPGLTTSALVGDSSEMLATLGLVEVDLRAMTIACQLAGHPPPILRRPDGSVEQFGGDPLPPIGMVRSAGDPCEAWELSTGCTIVLYSDGLIERRGADLAERLAELETIVGELDSEASAAQALHTICTAMLTDASEDDVAILVLKVREDMS
jgi:hypothetical protein